MEFNKEDIINDSVFKDFIRSRGIKEQTIRLYESRIRHYCNFTGKSPSELIEEAEEEQDAGIKRRRRKVKIYLLDFIDYQKEKGRGKTTIKSYIETIKGFYYDNDIDIPKIRNSFKDTNNPTLEKLPTKEEYITAIKHCVTLRDKAILLLQLSSGMGAAEVRNLKYYHFYNALKEYINLHESDIFDISKIKHQTKEISDLVGIWQVVRYKTGMPYITFSSPEATHAIIDYLIERNIQKSIVSLEEPLFIANGKQISEHAFSFIYRRINQRANFGNRNKNRDFLTSHIPRKMFATTMYESDVEFMAVEWMLGHKIDDTRAAYYKNNVENLKKQYLEGLEGLTLEKIKVKKVTTPEYDILLKELNELRERDENYEKELERKEDMIKALEENMAQIQDNIDIQIEELKKEFRWYRPSDTKQLVKVIPSKNMKVIKGFKKLKNE